MFRYINLENSTFIMPGNEKATVLWWFIDPFYNDKVEEWFSSPPVFLQRNQKKKRRNDRERSYIPSLSPPGRTTCKLFQTGLFDSENGSKKYVVW